MQLAGAVSICTKTHTIGCQQHVDHSLYLSYASSSSQVSQTPIIHPRKLLKHPWPTSSTIVLQKAGVRCYLQVVRKLHGRGSEVGIRAIHVLAIILDEIMHQGLQVITVVVHDAAATTMARNLGCNNIAPLRGSEWIITHILLPQLQPLRGGARDGLLATAGPFEVAQILVLVVWLLLLMVMRVLCRRLHMVHVNVVGGSGGGHSVTWTSATTHHHPCLMVPESWHPAGYVESVNDDASKFTRSIRITAVIALVVVALQQQDSQGFTKCPLPMHQRKASHPLSLSLSTQTRLRNAPNACQPNNDLWSFSMTFQAHSLHSSLPLAYGPQAQTCVLLYTKTRPKHIFHSTSTSFTQLKPSELVLQQTYTHTLLRTRPLSTPNDQTSSSSFLSRLKKSEQRIW